MKTKPIILPIDPQKTYVARCGLTTAIIVNNHASDYYPWLITYDNGQRISLSKDGKFQSMDHAYDLIAEVVEDEQPKMAEERSLSDEERKFFDLGVEHGKNIGNTDRIKKQPKEHDWSEVVVKLYYMAYTISPWCASFHQKALAILQEFDCQNPANVSDKQDSCEQMSDKPLEMPFGCCGFGSEESKKTDRQHVADTNVGNIAQDTDIHRDYTEKLSELEDAQLSYSGAMADLDMLIEKVSDFWKDENWEVLSSYMEKNYSKQWDKYMNKPTEELPTKQGFKIEHFPGHVTFGAGYTPPEPAKERLTVDELVVGEMYENVLGDIYQFLGINKYQPGATYLFINIKNGFVTFFYKSGRYLNHNSDHDIIRKHTPAPKEHIYSREEIEADLDTWQYEPIPPEAFCKRGKIIRQLLNELEAKK